MHSAIIENDPGKLRELLDTDSRARYSYSLFITAASRPECLRVLLEYGADQFDTTIIKNCRKTELFRTITENPESLRLLLEYNVYKEVHHATLLAESTENPECIKVLLDHGANPNPVVKLGGIYHEDGGEGAVVTMSQKYLGATPLGEAAQNGHDESVRLLLEAGANPDRKATYYATPLQDAIRFRHFECVRLLIKHGADLNNTGNYRTPLFLAVSQEDFELGDRSARQSNHMLPNYFKSASAEDIKQGRIECIKLLLEKGANPNKANNHKAHHDNDTPILHTSRYGKYEYTELLLKYGANPNCANKNGDTPLIGAVQREKFDHVKLLVAYGAEVPIEGDRFDALNENQQGFLLGLKTIKDSIKASIETNETLDSNTKILVEKIVNKAIFSSDKTLEELSSAESVDFINSSIEQATEIAMEISTLIANHDKATQDFISANAHFIDPSLLCTDFKSWNVKQIGSKKALVNLAVVCGGKVHGIESLDGFSSGKVQIFIITIPKNDDGTLQDCSADEFKLVHDTPLLAVSKNPLQSLEKAIADKTGSQEGEEITNFIVSFLNTDVELDGAAAEEEASDYVPVMGCNIM